ncbi:MAG TPA: stage III sporulation protein AB [Feifaniaceae bacterium]|nr:stage III sporulation protein AB [Feifaniaceae bacterium]
MLHVLAMMSVFAGCAFIGVRASSALRLRKDTLRAMADALHRLSMWMDYTAQPLRALARKAKTEETAAFFDAFAKYLKTDEDVPSAWKRAMEDARSNDAGFASLHEAELNILEEYAGTLGGSDRETQAKNAALAQRRLEAVLKEAEEIYASKGRMYRSVGILSGIAVAILLW